MAADFAEAISQLIGASRELTVGNRFAAANDCSCIRPFLRLPVDIILQELDAHSLTSAHTRRTREKTSPAYSNSSREGGMSKMNVRYPDRMYLLRASATTVKEPTR